MLADLKIGGIGGAFDEIAGRVDHEQAHSLAHDLAAEQKRNLEIHVGALQRLALGLEDGADDVPDALGGLKHGRRVHQRFVLAGFGIVVALGQYADHRLADREVPRCRDRHDALLGVLEHVQFAEGRNVVDPGIGPRVREHHQALAYQNSAAISHGFSRSPCVGL